MEDPFVRVLMGLIALGIGGIVAWATVSIRRDQREILRLQRRAADDLEGVESHTRRMRVLAEDADKRSRGEITARGRHVTRGLAALIDARPTDTLRSPRGVVGDEDDVLPRR